MSVFIAPKKLIEEKRSPSEAEEEKCCVSAPRRILVHFYVEDFVDTTDRLTTRVLFDIVASIVCTDCLNLSSLHPLGQDTSFEWAVTQL